MGAVGTAIVMAGRREGTIDPLAAAAGLADKCLVPVAGRPMIAHVLGALASAGSIGRIIVSINDPAILDQIPEARNLIDAARLIAVRARHNLVDSLLAAIEGAAYPVVVTTADNVLLTPAAIDAIGYADDAAVAVAFARRAAVLAAHPDGQRRFYRFRDDSYSNCNTYRIGTQDALRAAEVFRTGGQFAKHPWRIVKALGLYNLVAFRFGLGTLDAAFARFSRRFGFRIRPFLYEDGAIAIDVDNARTLAVAEAIFAGRAR